VKNPLCTKHGAEINTMLFPCLYFQQVMCWFSPSDIDWKTLSYETIHRVLEQNSLRFTAELELLKAVDSWGMHQAKKHGGGQEFAREKVNNLLILIRIKQITYEDFAKISNELNTLSDSEKLQILQYLIELRAVKKSHNKPDDGAVREIFDMTSICRNFQSVGGIGFEVIIMEKKDFVNRKKVCLVANSGTINAVLIMSNDKPDSSLRIYENVCWKIRSQNQKFFMDCHSPVTCNIQDKGTGVLCRLKSPVQLNSGVEFTIYQK
jgi:hypothetical protein